MFSFREILMGDYGSFDYGVEKSIKCYFRHMSLRYSFVLDDIAYSSEQGIITGVVIVTPSHRFAPHRHRNSCIRSQMDPV